MLYTVSGTDGSYRTRACLRYVGNKMNPAKTQVPSAHARERQRGQERDKKCFLTQASVEPCCLHNSAGKLQANNKSVVMKTQTMRLI
jgi:hypothetical protein